MAGFSTCEGSNAGWETVLHEEWTKLLADNGQDVSYPGFGVGAEKSVLFCVDESQIDTADGPVLALALVALEDRSFVSSRLRKFREDIHAAPFVTTEATVLEQEGLHYNSLSEDVRTRVVDLVSGLPARVFLSYGRLT